MSPSPARKKRATVHDVAVRSGVSRGTVSRFVNGEGYVSAAARQAIEEAIEAVGYVPNTAARNLKMQRSQSVGFIVHEPSALFVGDPNIGEILLGANAVLSDADHQMAVLVVDSERDTDRVARYLAGGFVEGAVVVSARSRDPISRAIERLELPSAYVGHPPGAARTASFVVIDNHRAAADITGHLRSSGRSRIAMIAAALDRDSGADRLAGYTEALGDLFDPDLVEGIKLYSYAGGRDAAASLLRRRPDVDAIFAASDAVAAGAIEALRLAGRRVPEDVAVAGFDDSTWATRALPSLTTVHQPARELGEVAAQLVLDQLLRDAAPREVELPSRIVVRDSA